MALPRHGHYVFETSNGLVEFRLGEDTITNQKHVHIRRGDEPAIGITTSNGNISIRGRDMKGVDD